jgi:hypothetical protein
VIGEERTGRGTEDEKRSVKHLVKLILTAGQIVRLEAALEVAEVVLDVLPEEEKSRLEGEQRELREDEDLLIDLLLRKASWNSFSSRSPSQEAPSQEAECRRFGCRRLGG